MESTLGGEVYVRRLWTLPYDEVAIPYCSQHDFPYIRGWMQMVTSTKWFIFLKQWYSKAQSLLQIHYIIAVQYTRTLTLCITVSWSRGKTVSRVFGHAAMSLLLHCPEPTAAPPPFLGGRALLFPRWHPFSHDPRTLPPSVTVTISSVMGISNDTVSIPKERTIQNSC
jgi:hypothetical protein